MKYRRLNQWILFVVFLMSPRLLIFADNSVFKVLGLEMKTEVTGLEADNAMSVVRVKTPAGSGPPAHVHHRDDELFIILKGHYKFWLGDQDVINASTGDVIFMPKGIAHQYLNVGDEQGSHYFVTVPGGLDELFTEIHSGQLTVPKDQKKIIELSEKYGIEYVPPLNK